VLLFEEPSFENGRFQKNSCLEADSESQPNICVHGVKLCKECRGKCCGARPNNETIINISVMIENMRRIASEDVLCQHKNEEVCYFAAA
jgi:hypothetical protein